MLEARMLATDYFRTKTSTVLVGVRNVVVNRRGCKILISTFKLIRETANLG